MEHKVEQANEPVPYVVHESDMARSDIKNKRLWMTINAIVAGLIIYGVVKHGESKRSINRV